MTGCFGSFELVRDVHRFNRDIVQERWQQEALFIGLNVVPVYLVTTAIDLAVFNLIELHSGRNPLSREE